MHTLLFWPSLIAQWWQIYLLSEELNPYLFFKKHPINLWFKPWILWESLDYALGEIPFVKFKLLLFIFTVGFTILGFLYKWLIIKIVNKLKLRILNEAYKNIKKMLAIKRKTKQVVKKVPKKPTNYKQSLSVPGKQIAGPTCRIPHSIITHRWKNYSQLKCWRDRFPTVSHFNPTKKPLNENSFVAHKSKEFHYYTKEKKKCFYYGTQFGQVDTSGAQINYKLKPKVKEKNYKQLKEVYSILTTNSAYDCDNISELEKFSFEENEGGKK